MPVFCDRFHVLYRLVRECNNEIPNVHSPMGKRRPLSQRSAAAVGAATQDIFLVMAEKCRLKLKH